MARLYVVTGSGSGIGAATAAELRSRGADVVGADLRGADIEADLATEAGRARLADEVRRIGRIDALIACAGVRWDLGDSRGGSDAQTIVRVNFFGAVRPLLALRELLAESPAPRAVTISSTFALRAEDESLIQACLENDEDRALALCPDDGERAYNASKAAIARWVRRNAPSQEWAGAGIALNAVAPAMIATPMAPLITDELREEQLRVSPLGGIGRPEQVASLLAWLASEANGFVSGQTVFVDGAGDALARPEASPI